MLWQQISKVSAELHILSIIVLKSEWDHVEELLNKISSYTAETVIYPMDRYLGRKKISLEDYSPFVELLVSHYGSKIKERLSYKLRRYGM